MSKNAAVAPAIRKQIALTEDERMAHARIGFQIKLNKAEKVFLAEAATQENIGIATFIREAAIRLAERKLGKVFPREDE